MRVWLMLILPGAEELVAGWRREHDPYQAFGVPAHLTVRKPFLSRERWNDSEVRESLRRLIPVEVTLARMEARPGALVIVVEPDQILREMTTRISAALPELPPHKADRPDLAYHVTVVRTADHGVRADASRQIGRYLPTLVAGTELWAGTATGDGYSHAVLARAS